MVNLDIDVLAVKVGGRFHLVSLIQKRVRELMQGAEPLVENTEGMTLEGIAGAELLAGKLWLLTGEEAEKTRQKREKKAIAATADKADELPWTALAEGRTSGESGA
jgi:DNA-directed RNA polymerase subunit K/omega